MGNMMNGMMGWGWIGAILGLLILLLIIAVLAAGLTYLLRALRKPQAGGVMLRIHRAGANLHGRSSTNATPAARWTRTTTSSGDASSEAEWRVAGATRSP